MIVNYDYHPLFRKYFYYYQLSAVEFDTYLEAKVYIDDAINYLNDEDNPFGSEKIWGYLNAKL